MGGAGSSPSTHFRERLRPPELESPRPVRYRTVRGRVAGGPRGNPVLAEEESPDDWRGLDDSSHGDRAYADTTPPSVRLRVRRDVEGLCPVSGAELADAAREDDFYGHKSGPFATALCCPDAIGLPYGDLMGDDAALERFNATLRASYALGKILREIPRRYTPRERFDAWRTHLGDLDPDEPLRPHLSPDPIPAQCNDVKAKNDENTKLPR